MGPPKKYQVSARVLEVVYHGVLMGLARAHSPQSPMLRVV